MFQHEKFMEAYPEVAGWLKDRPLETRRKFAAYLKKFCDSTGMKPEEWRSLDKFEARDLAWKYVKPYIAESPSVAYAGLIALKSFFRNKNGEQLPFDSGRGGKHYIHVRSKKLAIEHIPNKGEMYQIIDMASSLRDKAILLLLFQSGGRVNVLEHLSYSDVQEQLDKDIITLKITGDLDHKLRGRDIPFYYSFVNGEGAQTLKQYCQVTHKNSKPTAPLFPTYKGKAVTKQWVWQIVKNCVRRAGFNPKTVWTHTIRKAFRKIVRQTNIDDDDKEQLMGHVIPGSRASYYDNKDVDLIKKAYQKCNFSREIPQSETQKLREQLEKEHLDRRNLETLVMTMKAEMEELKKSLKEIKTSS